MKRIQIKNIKSCVSSIVLLGLASCSTESLQENAPYNPNTVISKSLTACHQSEFEEGKSTLEKVMTTEKSNPFYWNALGICFALSNQLQKAMFYYELGLESVVLYKGTDKKLAEATLVNNIGLIHLYNKRFNESYFAFKRAEALAPDTFGIQLNLSQLLLEFKHDIKAMTILKKLEAMRPGDADVLYSLALVYSRSNEYEKALLTLAKITPETSTRPDVAGLHAFNLLKTNQLTEAKSIIEKRLTSYGKGDFDEYNKRNKILEKEISAKLDEQSAQKKQ
jgi:tetratricopeptide (TPR) repeat protein